MSGKKPTRKEQILQLAKASPGIKTKDAASILGMSTGNLGTYTTQLRKEGLLKKTRGTLELADGAETNAAAPGDEPSDTEESKAKVKDTDLPREARIRAAKKLLAEDSSGTSSPPPPAGNKPAAKKTKGKSKKPAYKMPKATKKNKERLSELVREGLRRVEAYRRQGVLTNIAVVGKANGEIMVRGLGGGPALVTTMLGHPDPEVMGEPAQKQRFNHITSQLGDGEGELVVYYNLTDIGGDDGEPMQALMAGWIGGKRLMCAAAPLNEDTSLIDAKAWPWEDLSPDQIADIYRRQVAEIEESGDPEQVGMTLFRSIEDEGGEEAAATMLPQIMADPERAPMRCFSAYPEHGGIATVLHEMNDDFAQKLDGAPAAIAEQRTARLTDPDEIQRAMDDMSAAAVERAEQFRQEGLLTNIIAVLKSDGSVEFKGAMGGGGMLALMVGTPDDQFGQQESPLHGQVVRDLGGGDALFVMFINLVDVGEDQDMKAVAALWAGWGEQGACIEASLDGPSLATTEAWRSIGPERRQELYELGVSLAESDSQTMMRHMPGFDEDQIGASMAAVMEDDERAPLLVFPVPGSDATLAADGHGKGDEPGVYPLERKLVDLAGSQPGIKLSAAAKAIGVPKKVVKATAKEMAGEGTLMEEGGRIYLPDPVQEPSGAPDLLGMDALITQAIAQVEKERQQETLVNFVEIAKADGQTMRAGMGGGQIMMPMSGMMGDQIEEMIAIFGGGQGKQAVFVSMMDLASDGIDRVVMAAWDGPTLAGAWTALVTDGPLDDLDNWMSIDAEALLQIGLQSHAANQAAGSEDEGSMTISAPMSTGSQQVSEMSDEEKSAEVERRVQMMKDLTVQACEIAEDERKAGVRANTVLVGLQDGSTRRVGMGEEMMAIMCGAMGEQTADLISQMGEGQGIMAVFLNMGGLPENADGTYMALMSIWAGDALTWARSAIVGQEPLDYESDAWNEIPPDRFQAMIGDAAELTIQDD